MVVLSARTAQERTYVDILCDTRKGQIAHGQITGTCEHTGISRTRERSTYNGPSQCIAPALLLVRRRSTEYTYPGLTTPHARALADVPAT